MDNICDDYESKDIEKHIGRTTITGKYAFYDPERPEKHRHYDIGSAMGITVKYDTAVDFSGFTMTGDNYNKIMQSLNVKQNGLCNYLIHWIQTREEPMNIFIEGGAKALYESVVRYYNTQQG